jgi:hypothetical protein
VVLWASGAALAILAVLARACLVRHPDLAVILMTAAAGPWLLALASLRRLPDRRAGRILIIAVAAALRLPFLFAPPAGSDDYHRYLWDGRVQRAGINPYRFSPDAPELARLRDGRDWPHVNHPEISTIYPPLAQMVFALAPSLRVWKAIVLGADLAVALLLSAWLRRRGEDPRRALAWAWSPLCALELSLDAHMDVLAILPLCAALFAGAARPVRAGMLLGLSAAAKLLGAAVALPLLRDRGRAWLAFAAVLLLVGLPYLGAGGRLGAGLDVYGRKWIANAGVYTLACAVTQRALEAGHDPTRPRMVFGSGALARLVTGERDRREVFADELANALSRLLLGVAFLALVVHLTVRGRAPADAAALLVAGFLLLTPALLPWYALFAVPWLALPRIAGGPALAALAAGAPLFHLGYPRAAPSWTAWSVHGLAWLLLATSAWKENSKRV